MSARARACEMKASSDFWTCHHPFDPLDPLVFLHFSPALFPPPRDRPCWRAAPSPRAPCAAMPPWAHQCTFEEGLRSLRKASASKILELTALALDEPRASYKGVAGALAHEIKKAKRRHRCVACVARSGRSAWRGGVLGEWKALAHCEKESADVVVQGARVALPRLQAPGARRRLEEQMRQLRPSRASRVPLRAPQRPHTRAHALRF
jgi:hypothetical protein